MRAKIGSVIKGTLDTRVLANAFFETLCKLDSRYKDWPHDSSMVQELFDELNKYAPEGCKFCAQGGNADYGFWIVDWEEHA